MPSLGVTIWLLTALDEMLITSADSNKEKGKQ
jgi:hypothetical protein